MNAWMKLVKKIFDENENRVINGKKYTYKDALRDAKKVYKKGSHKKHTDTPYPGKVGGGGSCGATIAPVPLDAPTVIGGKSKSRRKSSCGGKGKSSRRTKKCSMY